MTCLCITNNVLPVFFFAINDTLFDVAATALEKPSLQINTCTCIWPIYILPCSYLFCMHLCVPHTSLVREMDEKREFPCKMCTGKEARKNHQQKTTLKCASFHH